MSFKVEVERSSGFHGGSYNLTVYTTNDKEQEIIDKMGNERDNLQCEIMLDEDGNKYIFIVGK